MINDGFQGDGGCLPSTVKKGLWDAVRTQVLRQLFVKGLAKQKIKRAVVDNQLVILIPKGNNIFQSVRRFGGNQFALPIFPISRLIRRVL